MVDELVEAATCLKDFIEAVAAKAYSGPVQERYQESIAAPKKPQVAAFCEKYVGRLEPQERRDLVHLIRKMSGA
jgi:hypothetical protein